MPTVLVIDDNPDVGDALQLLLSLQGIATHIALSPEEGLKALAQADLVIQDMNFSADTTSGDEGVALFQRIRLARPDLPVILLTAWTQLERAVQLVKLGAADYLGKPWDDQKLLATVQNLLELSEAQQQLQQQHQQQRTRWRRLRERLDLGELVAESAAMLSLLELAAPVAQMPTTEAAIDNGFWRDVYLVIGDPQEGGGWAVRTYIKPLSNWIWGGSILMALGGLLSLSDRRFRVGAVTRRVPADPGAVPAE